MIEVTPLKWDSDFFKKQIVSLNYSESNETDELECVIKEQYEKGIKLIYVFSDKVYIPHRLLDTYNGLLVDKKVIYVKNIKEGEESSSIFAFKDNSKLLYTLARQSGEYSRFKRDPNFAEDDFIRFYDKWIENSVNGEIADVVFVYVTDEIIKGLITAKIKGDRVVIGLLAVSEEYRGEGIAYALMNHLADYGLKHGIREMEVVTQCDNVPACKFYEKQGMHQSDITYVYHFWLNKIKKI